MKQVLIRGGKAIVEDVPAPIVEPGTLLVAVRSSCISVGTEMSGILNSGQPLWRRALKDPGKIKKAFDLVANRGFLHAASVIRGEVTAGSPTGYSAAGVVAAVGSGVLGFEPGDRVACAGAQCAHHAEFIRVPENLVVRIPDPLDFTEASTVTLGAIALQGVRRAQPTLGETFVVLGLGILGQLTLQLLKANGCRVIGIDHLAHRVDLAKRLGLDFGVDPTTEIDLERIIALTGGVGADGVIVTAASADEALLSHAFQMCRRKGRVVLVGDVPIQINRVDIYQKELEFYISTSYGPGRYDRRYEEEGLDYPIGYVRWTENRNMGEYLRQVAAGTITVDPLVGDIYPIGDADKAYETLRSQEPRPLTVVLQYPEASTAAAPATSVENRCAPTRTEGRIRLALIGAGGFARGVHLPNLQGLAHLYRIQAVASRSGPNALAVARQYGASYATTDFHKILEDDDVDAVLIATRHNLHAELTLAALNAGKHVLVEKPLAVTASELERMEAFFAEHGESPVLLTGFNRRFSPHTRRILELTADRVNPCVINYQMNAGYLPPDHWAHGTEGGGRNIGEACHIYDLFTALAGCRSVSVSARSISPRTANYRRDDNFVATLGFEDGSVATLTYTALGSGSFPKERMSVFADGKVLTLDDYRETTVFGGRFQGVRTQLAEKGQREELIAFASAVRGESAWPIAPWEQLQATRIALEVQSQLVPSSDDRLAAVSTPD